MTPKCVSWQRSRKDLSSDRRALWRLQGLAGREKMVVEKNMSTGVLYYVICPGVGQVRYLKKATSIQKRTVAVLAEHHDTLQISFML